MRSIYTIALFTFKESMARRTFIAFFVLSSLTLAFFLFAMNIEVVNGALASLSLFGKTADIPENRIVIERFMRGIHMGLATLLYTAGIFFSIFAASGLYPNLLEKGNIDWILSKPISRFQMLAGRFLGGLGIVAFNIFYLIVGSWLILSIKSGYWNVSFLSAGLLIVWVFAALFALMALLGVLFQNAAISVMGAYLMIFLSPMLFQRERAYALLSRKIYQLILDGLYYICPPIFETGEIMKKLIFHEPIASYQPLLHLSLLIVGYLALAQWVLSRKDF